MTKLRDVSCDSAKASKQSVLYPYSWVLYSNIIVIVTISLNSNKPVGLCNGEAMCFP
jgi:hypothetical protein